jgi:hypothetical protein
LIVAKESDYPMRYLLWGNDVGDDAADSTRRLFTWRPFQDFAT